MKYVKPLYENENGEKFLPGDLVIISSGQFKYFLGKSRERVWKTASEEKSTVRSRGKNVGILKLESLSQEEETDWSRKKKLVKIWTCTVERPVTINYSFDIPVGAKIKIRESYIRKYEEEDLCDIICKHISRTIPITWKVLENKEVMIDVYYMYEMYFVTEEDAEKCKKALSQTGIVFRDRDLHPDEIDSIKKDTIVAGIEELEAICIANKISLDYEKLRKDYRGLLSGSKTGIL